jgi:eukaryotic-like serine/threonine-protein kinase
MVMAGRWSARVRRLWRVGAVVPGLAAAVALGTSGTGLASATSGADWSQFRFNSAHTGVTSETAINSGNAGKLTTLWTVALPGRDFASPAVVADSAGMDLVYVGDLSGTFFAYNAFTGKQVWSANLRTEGIYGSPAVFGGTVYVDTEGGSLYALNAATGATECSKALGGGSLDTSPDVTQAPDGSGALVLLGGLSHEEWAVYGAGNSHGQCTVDWAFDADSFPGTWSSPAYGVDEQGRRAVLFGSKDPDDSVYSIDVSTGHLIWKHQTSTLTELDVGGAPTISAPGRNGFADGAVYIEGKDGMVYALDLTTGALRWSFKAADHGLSASSGALAGGTLVIGSADGVYALNATTGAMLWHQLSGTVVASPAVTGSPGHQVAFVGSTGSLYGFSVATGYKLWTSPGTADGYYASAAVSHGRLYDVDMSGQLTAYALPAAGAARFWAQGDRGIMGVRGFPGGQPGR